MKVDRNVRVATAILVAMIKEKRALEGRPALTPAQYRHLMTLRELNRALDSKRN